MIHAQIFNTRSLTDTNAPAIQGITLSGAGTVYSDPFSGMNSDGASMTVFTTGTLTGTFTLWFTDVRNPSLADDSQWTQDTTFAPTNPAGAAIKFTDSMGNAKALRKRLKFVGASGAGTITGYATVPQFR
jgi:hypothetical protein